MTFLSFKKLTAAGQQCFSLKTIMKIRTTDKGDSTHESQVADIVAHWRLNLALDFLVYPGQQRKYQIG
jgi:hypothetical protein